MARECTRSFGPGSKLARAPLASLTRARWSRRTPPTLVKRPPMKTLKFDQARVSTTPLGFGFQLVAIEFTGLTAPASLRLKPPIVVKSPPTYSMPECSWRAYTGPLGAGLNDVVLPERSISARNAWAKPFTVPKVPPAMIVAEPE